MRKNGKILIVESKMGMTVEEWIKRMEAWSKTVKREDQEVPKELRRDSLTLDEKIEFSKYIHEVTKVG